eukprot:767967-Pelagomonas_calceolata.AAC.1
MSEILDLLLAGMDQPQADQPSSLGEGLPVQSNLRKEKKRKEKKSLRSLEAACIQERTPNLKSEASPKGPTNLH